MTRDDCEVISELYYSNCWVEAFKVKIRHPKTVKLYFCNPYRDMSGQIRSAHIMWEDKTNSYDFSDQAWEDQGNFWQYFWYKGVIRKWPKGFAKEFIERRNRIAKKSWKRRRKT